MNGIKLKTINYYIEKTSHLDKKITYFADRSKCNCYWISDMNNRMVFDELSLPTYIKLTSRMPDDIQIKEIINR